MAQIRFFAVNMTKDTRLKNGEKEKDVLWYKPTIIGNVLKLEIIKYLNILKLAQTGENFKKQRDQYSSYFI